MSPDCQPTDCERDPSQPGCEQPPPDGDCTADNGCTPPPTEEVLAQIAQPWVWRRSPRARRDPAPGQLALF